MVLKPAESKYVKCVLPQVFSHDNEHTDYFPVQAVIKTFNFLTSLYQGYIQKRSGVKLPRCSVYCLNLNWYGYAICKRQDINIWNISSERSSDNFSPSKLRCYQMLTDLAS